MHDTVLTHGCSCGWKICSPPGLGGQCGQCGKSLDPKQLDETRLQNIRHSNALWRELHSYGIVHATTWDVAVAKTWFAGWLARVPRFGCADCKTKFAKYCEKQPPEFSSADAFFCWSVTAHNYVSTHHVAPPKPPMTIADARRIYWPPHASSNLHHVITWDQFTRDTLTLAQVILDRYPDVSGVAGIPRSGLRAATDIAIRLGVPLYEASVGAGLRYIGGGSRIRSTAIHGDRREHSGPIVIVDDSTCSGSALAELTKHDELSGLPKFVVYAASPGIQIVEGYAINLELPHWFDWNMLNNGQILKGGNTGIDFDGVLCSDCLPEDDDDGARYRAWLQAVRPIRTPRDFTVPFIITARREAYRELTVDWLNRYRIQYGQLVMFPGTFAERARTDIGQWKAGQCDRLGVGLFVESDNWQAKRIAELRSPIVVSMQPAPR